MQDIAPEPQLHAAQAIGQLATVAPDSDVALALFDAAITVVEPHEALLSGAPARELMVAMTAVVTALGRIDPDRVARKQTWFHRFTGADLEARLEFEVSIRTIGDEMRKLAMSALEASRTRALLVADIAKLETAHTDNEELILATRALLARAAAGTGIGTDRIERRLANLEALHASNQLSRAQMRLTIDHIGDLLDRYRDIEQLLYPIWQQNALAVAQSIVAPGDLPEQLTALEAARSRLDVALRRKKDPLP